MAEIFFSDFDYSFAAHPKTGDITILQNENSVKNSLKNLLLTKFGEVLFNSQLGSGIYYKLFEPMDNITKVTMQREIETTINNFEPRVSLNSIDITEDTNSQGYFITLYYTLINTYNIQQVTVFLERIR